MPNWPHGLGESLGDSLLTASSLITSGEVIYVHHTGSNSYSGFDRDKPKATLAGAVAIISLPSTIIVLLDGHTEIITSQVLIEQDGGCPGDGTMILGAGSSGGIPTVSLTPSGIGSAMISIQAIGVCIRNVKFKANASADSQFKVDVTGLGNTIVGTGGFVLEDCYFECGATDTDAQVGISARSHYGTIRGCTFISTATSVTAQPLCGITTYLSGENFCRGWVLEDTVFDGGTAGFSKFEAFSDTDNIFLNFRMERISLLRGADVTLGGSDTGLVSVGTSSGGAMVEWT